MSCFRKLTHTIGHCQYRIVWLPKYRHKILTGAVGNEVGNCIRAFSQQKEFEIVEMNIQPDHVHILAMVPTKIFISDYYGIVKGRTAIRVFNKYRDLKDKPYWVNHFWTEGYCVAGGLWAGVVVFDSVTRLQGVAPASTATTSTVPMRVLVHVDASGGAMLLNHVTIMQQNGEQVLVVDDSKIPFYEGIETRNGKSVGQRMTSIGYDMPRDRLPTAQAGLVDSVAAADGVEPADVTAEQINTWVDGRSERPSALAETYVTAWPLDGTLDSTLSSSAPLQLDPFHRSNPFRHAFHPRHGTGLAIARAITIAIDDSSEVGVVEGTYQETITGLADDPVILSGNVILQRVSTVTSLQ